MRSQKLPVRHVGHVRTSSTTSLLAHLGEPISEADRVLLCSFGVHPDAEQTIRQLCDALLSAGFTTRMTRHLVRKSPVLRRSARGRYRIRPFEC